MAAIARITVLVSGRGSNLRALIDAERRGRLAGTIAAVLCNRADAPALEITAEHGIASQVIEHRVFANRDAFEAALAAAIDASEPDLIVLAGFMRVLGAALVARYAGRMLNIHPSLLPSYPGLDTHRRALADGVRVHGCTVHFVTPDVDHGPIVMQGAVAVHDGDDEQKLAARVLAVEHQVLPAAVRAFCEHRLVIAGRRVHVMDEVVPGAVFVVPLPEAVGARGGESVPST
jgi:phosphoribosylglycinamide formyltransferase-1